MPPPHRMLSRNPTKEQTPTGPSLHSNLGRHRILRHRRIHRRGLETTPAIHHPLLENNTPPRRSSTKNHDNRRTRKLDRRRINPRVRKQQMGPEENPGRNATSICFSIGVGMHAIPRNESDHASRNCRQLTRPHPGPLISTKETNRPSTVFAIPLDLTWARFTVPTCGRQRAKASAGEGVVGHLGLTAHLPPPGSTGSTTTPPRGHGPDPKSPAGRYRVTGLA